MDHRHHEHTSSAATPLAPDSATVYTCPMHPEVRQDHPLGWRQIFLLG